MSPNLSPHPKHTHTLSAQNSILMWSKIVWQKNPHKNENRLDRRKLQHHCRLHHHRHRRAHSKPSINSTIRHPIIAARIFCPIYRHSPRMLTNWAAYSVVPALSMLRRSSSSDNSRNPAIHFWWLQLSAKYQSQPIRPNRWRRWLENPTTSTTMHSETHSPQMNSVPLARPMWCRRWHKNRPFRWTCSAMRQPLRSVNLALPTARNMSSSIKCQKWWPKAER